MGVALGQINTAALAANGTVDGQQWHVVDYMARAYSTIRAFAESDQAGTLTIWQSADGNTWFQTSTVAVTAGQAKTLVDNIVLPYVKAHYVNGATGQGSFTFSSALAP